MRNLVLTEMIPKKHTHSQETIDGLKMEIPMYIAASEDVSTEIDLIAWWKRHAIELPKWVDVFKKVLLVQPSSAAAERVFPFLQKIYCTSAVIFGRLHRSFCNAAI